MKRTLLLLPLLVGCRPDLDDGTALVTAPRVLAVSARPAEAKPGDAVTLTALVADATGVLEAPVSWARCDERKPLAEPGTIASSCVAGRGLTAFGVGKTAVVTVSPDACRLFGPDRPEPKPGEPAGRPADPDATGGYYQPIRVALDAVTFFDLRIRCGLAGATQEQTAELAARSRPNENPSILAWKDGAGTELADGVTEVSPGQKVTLRPTLSAPERYTLFDPALRVLVEREEQQRLTWYATAGVFAEERTGEGENTWTAPDHGDAVLLLVVRDDRGGVAFRTTKFRVR